MSQKYVFGYPAECADFETRNAEFLDRFPKFQAALDAAFVRDVTVSSAADKAILFLGRLCLEDFMELLLLASNGYGVGALKLLRGLYERAVTAAYLSKFPSEADAFRKFGKIQRHKILQAYIDGGTRDQKWIEAAEKAKIAFESVKGDFEVVACKKCGTKRINHTWSKLDFVSMARQTEIGILLAQAYYEPLNHAHSTVEAINLRVERTESGRMEFKPEAQRTDADRALQVAHAVMVALLEVQADHFNLPELKKLTDECANDLVEIWSKRDLAIDPAK